MEGLADAFEAWCRAERLADRALAHFARWVDGRSARPVRVHQADALVAAAELEVALERYELRIDPRPGRAAVTRLALSVYGGACGAGHAELTTRTEDGVDEWFGVYLDDESEHRMLARPLGWVPPADPEVPF